MKMNDHELIAAKATFNKWWEDERKEKSDVSRRPTRGEIWNYFHREFPREAIVKRITQYLENAVSNGRIVSSYIPSLAAEDLYAEIERLFHGDQEPTNECSFCIGTGECQGGDACHGNQMHDCPICKGTGESCLTCGGSTKVPIIVGHQCTVFPCYHVRESCPDCTEKHKCPTCKGSGEVPGGFHQLDTIPCPDCTEKCEHTKWIRDKKKPICIQCGESFSQRKSDRRSQTLTGSLKAMRPQN